MRRSLLYVGVKVEEEEDKESEKERERAKMPRTLIKKTLERERILWLVSVHLDGSLV